MQSKLWCSVLVVASVWLLPAIAEAATTAMFQGLGRLPGGTPHSEAYGVSGNGGVVVGYSSSGPGRFEGFRWTAGGGMVGLGNLSPADRESRAFAASDDGSAIAGFGSIADPNAFRWTADDGLVKLGINARRAYGISGDGAVVVGERPAGSDAEAFRWTAATGTKGLGYLPHLPEFSPISMAYGTSGDGSVVVGSSSSYSGQQAFRWTQAGGMTGLGDLPGGINNSGARAVTPDGTTIVGYGRSAAGQEAFLWTEPTGMKSLGDLPGGSHSSIAHALSADGSVVVGQGSSVDGPAAFLWDVENGMRNLKIVLGESGLNVSAWTLTVAQSISANGRTIVGTGVNPEGNLEAWVAVLSAVALLPGDFNDDGVVDAADYTKWRNGIGTDYTADDYKLWRKNFGRRWEPAGFGAGGIPEPGCLALLVATGITLLGSSMSRRRFDLRNSSRLRR